MTPSKRIDHFQHSGSEVFFKVEREANDEQA